MTTVFSESDSHTQHEIMRHKIKEKIDEIGKKIVSTPDSQISWILMDLRYFKREDYYYTLLEILKPIREQFISQKKHIETSIDSIKCEIEQKYKLEYERIDALKKQKITELTEPLLKLLKVTKAEFQSIEIEKQILSSISSIECEIEQKYKLKYDIIDELKKQETEELIKPLDKLLYMITDISESIKIKKDECCCGKHECCYSCGYLSEQLA